MASAKLWGGRFTAATNSTLEKLNSSIDLDKRMYAEDIAGSQAYARSLRTIGLLTDQETVAICEGLEKVKLEWKNEKFQIHKGDEDIHTANERRLKELIGDPASKLHVGRSRNDQVATDMKLWLRHNLLKIESSIKDLIKFLIVLAETDIDVIMPGYTHLQKAQPVRWSHWLLSYAWSFKSDADRLKQYLDNTNLLPLGSGALAGNPFPIDRTVLAYTLGFDGATQNSMHTVSDRDFVAEFLFWASLLGSHLSKFAEDLIIFSTKEFAFVTIDESFSTGSSLMPQKRNPDSLELIRGIGGSLFGQCCSFMMVLKGLPSTYNKDLQTDKEFMFSVYDKLEDILKVTNGIVLTMKVQSANCKRALNTEMLATDLAYYLVRKDVPFREAHHIAGRIVTEAEKRNVLLSDFTLEELRTFTDKFEADVTKVWNYESSVEQYQTVGGTSRNSVLLQIESLYTWLDQSNKI